MAKGNEIVLVMDRLANELTAIGWLARSLAKSIRQDELTNREISECSKIIDGIRDCLEAAKGARGLIRMDSKRFPADEH